MYDAGLKTSNGIFKILKFHCSYDEILTGYERRAKYQDLKFDVKNPETVYLEKELVQNHNKAVDQLKGNHKIAFDFFQEHFNLAEIAAKMKTTEKKILELLLEADILVEQFLNDHYLGK